MDFRRGGKAAIDRMIEAYGFTTKQALCERLGISSSTLANRYLRDTFPADYVIQCALETGVSLKWLTTGIGAKMENAPEPTITISIKLLSNGALIDSGELTLDKKLFTKEMNHIEAIQLNDTIYIISKNNQIIDDGQWAVVIDEKLSIRDVFRLPNDVLKVVNNHVTFETKLESMIFYGKVVSTYKYLH